MHGYRFTEFKHKRGINPQIPDELVGKSFRLDWVNGEHWVSDQRRPDLETVEGQDEDEEEEAGEEADGSDEMHESGYSSCGEQQECIAESTDCKSAAV